jgi:hypothetical protein
LWYYFLASNDKLLTFSVDPSSSLSTDAGFGLDLPEGDDALEDHKSTISIIKLPIVWIPLVMSFAALALVLSHAAIYGVSRSADEGSTAFVSQVLMATQLPFLIYFVIRWLPRQPRETVQVILMQTGAWLAAIAAVIWLT